MSSWRQSAGRLEQPLYDEPPGLPVYIMLADRKTGGIDMRYCRWVGLCALALGLGILIAAIFPTGFLLFLVAFLLIACGCGCMRR